MTTAQQPATNPTAILAAMNAVQKALAAEGISKSRQNQQQGYSFRGIDEVYNAVSRLHAENGIIVKPRYTERTVTERVTDKQKTLFYVVVTGYFTFVSVKDGSTLETGPFYGEAMDSGDKATNKAMSAALKYAMLQGYQIPTAGDNDVDATTHTVAPDPKPLTEEQLAGIRKQLGELGIKENLFCNALKIESLEVVNDVDLPGLQKMLDRKREAKAKEKPKAANDEKSTGTEG